MKWNKTLLEDYLKGKEERSVHINEYLLLIDFINHKEPETIIDIGTYLGASGYILGTCCDSIKEVWSIDNINSPEYYPKPEATREEHGKYLPKDAVFIKDGYEHNLMGLIDNGEEFIFWDAGKNSIKVINQFRLSKDLGVKHIAIHDSNVKSVRRSIKQCVKKGWYKIVEEDIVSCPEKGVTILQLIDSESPVVS